MSCAAADSAIYCLLASPLIVSPSPKVLLRMKYPFPLSTITDTWVIPPQVSVTMQSGLPNRFPRGAELHVVTVHSYEKLCGEISLPVEGEAPHCCKSPTPMTVPVACKP